MTVLRSSDNPRVRRWAGLVRDGRLRRSEGRAVIEGSHLISAWLERHGSPVAMVASETGIRNTEVGTLVRRGGVQPVLLADRLFRATFDVESPTGLAAEIQIPAQDSIQEPVSSLIFLDGIQDAGNVGAILRSAAAFGVRGALLSRGCADAWSPKALRAGMGGQFLLAIIESADLKEAMAHFDGAILCTVPHGGVPLDEVKFETRTGWIFGAEGQGVTGALAALATERVTIPMPGGTESLNVAAAAAICLYESARRRAGTTIR